MSTRAFRALLAAAVVCVAGMSAARAEVTGLQLTLSPYAGIAFWDNTVHLDDQLIFGGRGGLQFGRWVGIEGTYGYCPSAKTDFTPSTDVNVQHIGADVVFNLLPGYLVNPYLLGGWAELRFDPDAGETQTFNGWEGGIGLKIRLVERLALRLEARDVLVERDAPFSTEATHNVFVTGGLHLALGGHTRDADRDGVGDGRDRCPDTPAGALVDSHGCPTDADGDGVFDGLDQCASTMKGATVDAHGCPTDADGDGVFDGLDQCASTLKGARVDARGCPTDADKDGVWDGIDQCDATPAGAKVNDLGCPQDSDHDGVYDGIDVCENTPADMRVDKNGCPIEVSEKETQLLDTGMISLTDINFATAKWDIQSDSYGTLDEVGTILSQWPQLQIEIGGHTDSRGSEAYNQDLSQKRAQAVLDYLTAKFPSLKASQYAAKGYGEGKPVADNKTELGRAKNRRVEFKVMNREVLRKEVERRKLLKKDGGD
jgi:outer membrane protein OmpA-like peptidoglycan-associated protein